MSCKYLLFFSCILVSCTYNEIIPEINNSCDEQEGVDWIPSYNNCIDPIIKDNCIVCHGENSPSGSLTNFTQVIDMIENRDLLQRIKTDMPPSGIMSDNNINIIEQWINNGANNN
tara:strand:+ start:31 stop:375 length:345 start_codon:yes stop_codon:yes gene_type:complete